MFNSPYMNYPQYTNQYPQYNFPTNSAPTNSSIQYVNGLDSAKAYQIAPNSSVLLMDSAMDRFYVKKSDASGFSTVDIYDFHKAEEKHVTADFVSRQEFEELRSKITQYDELLNSLK